MSIDYDITSNFENLDAWITGINDKVVVQAGRAAINDTLKTMRQETVKIMGITYNLKPTTFSVTKVKKNMKLIRAKGKFLKDLEGLLIYSSSPIAMLNFVTGGKNRIKLKGVKIAKRRVLKAKIKPGKTHRIAGGFIQRKKTTQVFRGGQKDGFKKQSLPSQTVVMMRKKNLDKLFKRVDEVFSKNFANQVQWRLDKAAAKLTNKPMKKVK